MSEQEVAAIRAEQLAQQDEMARRRAEAAQLEAEYQAQNSSMARFASLQERQVVLLADPSG